MSNVIEVVIKGIDQASGPFSKINSSLGEFAKSVAWVSTVVAGSVVALTGMAIAVASAEEKVYTLAQRFGTTAEELSKWQKVAEYANVETDTFNTSIQFLSRNAANAAAGMKEAAAGFDRLGINAKTFVELPLGEKLQLLNEKMGGLKNQQERIAVAMQVFGRGGAAMVQMLDGNTKAAEELAQRVERLGGVISNQAAKNAESFMDKVGELQMAMGGLSRSIADEVIPVLGPLFSGTAETVADLAKKVKEFTHDAIVNIVAFGIMVGDTYDSFKRKFDTAFSSNQVSAQMDSWAVFLNWLGDAGVATFNAISDAILALWDALKFIGDMTLAWLIKPITSLLHDVILYSINEIYIKYNSLIVAAKQFMNLFGAGFDTSENIKAIDDAVARWKQGQISAADIGRQMAEDTKKAWKNVVPPRVDAVSGPAPTAGSADTSLADSFSLAKQKAESYLRSLNEATDATGALSDATGNAVSEADAWAAGLGNAIGDPMKNYYDTFKTTADATLSEADAWGQGIGTALGDPMMQYYADWDAERQRALESEGTVLTSLADMWQQYLTWQGSAVEEQARFIYDAMQSAITGISQGIAQVIVNGQNLAKTMQNVLKQVVADVIAGYVKMGIERLVLNKLHALTGVKEAGSSIATAATVGAANMMASYAMAPWPIDLGAPAAGAALGAKIAALAPVAVSAAAAGAAHGGLDYVPKEATYLLDRGERVLSPRQNKDLADFMAGGSGGGSVTIQNLSVSVLPNATNADALLNLPQSEINELVAGPIIRALNSLARVGVKPEYA